MLVSIGTFEYLKESGLDLRADHRDEFPPQYLRWIDETYTLTAAEINRDYVMRSAVYDAIQDVFETHDLLVSPTLAAMQTLNSDDGNTVGPSEVEGVEVDELIGWCMTYFMNFSGHPAASIPAGMVEGLPVGLQIIGRRYADVDVLAASAAFEQARPWQHTYQACIDRPL
jgi:amidase/aspartyl-tRNA(Asn)/glutamyl-tRNA(Gln) amidotransferase subunit A